MKTLADFKRALRLGSKWQAWHMLYGEQPLGIREIVEVKSTYVRIKSLDDGRTALLDYPKASDIKIVDGVVDIFWPDGRHILRYKKIGG